jgi:alkylation response protein AidB-like acyl-CoA dehydrogenase
MPARIVALMLAIMSLAAPAPAETAVETARALVARYHQDPAVIDRARDVLETALARDSQVETMIMLSYVCFLQGDTRATTAETKLAAYERGREVGQRAVELAPRNHDAHVWYAINTGRWGQTKGIMRSLFLLPTVRQEIDTIFALNPRSVRGHSLAGNVLLEIPGFVGGDRAKAEEHFRKGLEVDAHFTVLRLDLARVHILNSRYAEARREIQRVLDEPSPTIIADWTAKDVPRARRMLESIRDKT